MPSAETFIVAPTEPVWEYANVPGIADNDETLVQSYTVTGSPMLLDGITVSGTFAAEFAVYVNAVRKETQRIEVTSPSPTIPFNMPLPVGTVLEVKVTHYHVGSVHEFESTIRGHR